MYVQNVTEMLKFNIENVFQEMFIFLCHSDVIHQSAWKTSKIGFTLSIYSYTKKLSFYTNRLSYQGIGNTLLLTKNTRQ